MLTICVVFLFSVFYCDGSNVLCIFPFTAKSHFIMYEPLVLALHDRGHNITVISHFPQSEKKENLTDISIKGIFRSLHGNVSLKGLDQAPLNLFENLYQLYNDLDVYEPIFKMDEIKTLSKIKFDLIIIETFNTDMFLALVEHLNAPFIAISACPLMPWVNQYVSNPSHPSFIPVIFSDSSHEMNFSQRFSNFLQFTISNLFYGYFINEKSQKIARKYFPKSSPLMEIAKNTSLVLVNTHFSLHSPSPLSIKVIQVGGMHIKIPAKLNKELEKFISSAENGVILFSMGSMFRAESLPPKKLSSFLKTFERLPQKILWKWESDIAPQASKNIKFIKWLPQRDILAHPNIKLFIYHGGLMGTSEAVFSGVPILGIPLYGDMPLNMAAVKYSGIGDFIPFGEIDENTLYNAIEKIINNARYKRNAEKLSLIYRDRIVDPLTTAVYWTEYVIRHKGAYHMSSSATKLNWFEFYSIDIILACIIIITTTIYLAYKILIFTITISNSNYKNKVKNF